LKAVKRKKASEAVGISPEVKLSDARLFINRQISWLAFNDRVLAQARETRHPLLERCRFLAISATNLDEFFMIRVSGLQRQVASNRPHPNPDGVTPEEQLVQIHDHTERFLAEQRRILEDELMPALEREGIQILTYSQLRPKEERDLQQIFEQRILPILTPLAIDPAHPFPHISNLSVNLLVCIQDREREVMARVKVPTNLPRFLHLTPFNGSPAPGQHRMIRLVRIEDVIAANLGVLFPGKQVVGSFVFQVTRDADLVIHEVEAADLLEAIEDELDQRQFGDTVRLVIAAETPARLRDWLAQHLKVGPSAIYQVPNPIGLGSFSELTQLDRPNLLYPPYVPRIPIEIQAKNSIIPFIQDGDVLLHHPYDAFAPVVDFVRSAAADDNVLAIKQTLYRVGAHSPVVEALLQARENDVQVAALVELKARFDEEPNIEWARQMEAEGVHVAYGLIGLKTHAKICLIVRQEPSGFRRYAHLGTGNYNPSTARIYTDFSYFTDDPEICEDVADLFNYLTGYSEPQRYRKLLVAPVNFRDRIVKMINGQRDKAKRSEAARITFKMNGLTDPQIIRALYRAARAGVKINLIVRGICCLRPGIPGVSENIRVVSIVGRFLEHSRVYAFGQDAEEQMYLGSGDLMDRNLDGRVETLFPLEEALHRRRVRRVLELQLADTVNAWELKPDGSYARVTAAEGKPALDSQALLIAESPDGWTANIAGAKTTSLPDSAARLRAK